MKKCLGIILSVLMALSFIQGCSDGDSDKYGFMEINVSRDVDSTLNQNSPDKLAGHPMDVYGAVSYYLIDVYSIEDTQKPVVSTTRIDSPETSTMIYGLPVGRMLFVSKGYDAEGALIYQGSAERVIQVGNNGSLDISVSLAGWYWQDPLPQGNAIRSVWGTAGKDTGTDVFAAGDTGTILRYDGDQWITMDPGTGDFFYGVWGTAGTDVYVVGLGGMILHYNGENWAQMNSGTQINLNNIWGTSSTDIFAVGDGGAVLHYDGEKWTSMESGIHYWLQGIWGSSGTDVFATGWGGTLLYYDGSSWRSMDSRISAGAYYASWTEPGKSTGVSYAVGYFRENETGRAVIARNDGSQWNTVNHGIVGNYSLRGVWGSSASNVVAVGLDRHDRAPVTIRYDGASWKVEENGITGRVGLFCLWGASADDIFAGGYNWDSEVAVILHYDGNTWTSEDPGTTHNVGYDGIWGTSADNVYAVGYDSDEGGPAIGHYNGKQWTLVNHYIYENIDLKSVWGSSADNTYAVGHNMKTTYPGILRYDGSSWSVVDHGITQIVEFLRIWGTSADNIYLVGLHDDEIDGERGVIYHYDGQSWTDMGVMHRLDLQCQRFIGFKHFLGGRIWDDIPLSDTIIPCAWGHNLNLKKWQVNV